MKKSSVMSCSYFPGKNPNDAYLEGMMMEAPGPINFTMFLTMFGEKLNGTDPEEVIKNAFACFDEENTGEWLKKKVDNCVIRVLLDTTCYKAPSSLASFQMRVERCKLYLDPSCLTSLVNYHIFLSKGPRAY